jgi:hypothetical protein
VSAGAAVASAGASVVAPPPPLLPQAEATSARLNAPAMSRRDRSLDREVIGTSSPMFVVIPPTSSRPVVEPPERLFAETNRMVV